MAQYDPEITFRKRLDGVPDKEPDEREHQTQNAASGDGVGALLGAAAMLEEPQEDEDTPVQSKDDDEEEDDDDDDDAEDDAHINAAHAGRTPPVRRRRPPSKRLTMKPDSYNGEQDWEAYLSHFQDCADLSGWDSHMKKLVLSASLKGRARTYYMSLSAIEKRDYAHLVSALTRRFGTMRQREVWVAQLEGRRRQQGEAISALADDLHSMAIRAYHDLSPHAQEVLAMKQFYKSLPFELKYECIKGKCQTLYDAVAIVEQYEALAGERKRPVRAVSNTASEESTQEILQRLEQMEKAMEAQKNKGKVRVYDSPKDDSCWRCGSYEHRKYE